MQLGVPREETRSTETWGIGHGQLSESPVSGATVEQQHHSEVSVPDHGSTGKVLEVFPKEVTSVGRTGKESPPGRRVHGM